MRLLATIALLVIFLIERSEGKKVVPPGMNPDLFPTQTFDENAPFCFPEREPCGFYSFSLHGRAPFKWIKSWCRCSPKHDCIYDRTDMKMRVYRQTCVLKEEEEDEESIINSNQEQQQQPHRSHKIHRHVTGKQKFPFLV